MHLTYKLEIDQYWIDEPYSKVEGQDIQSYQYLPLGFFQKYTFKHVYIFSRKKYQHQ